MKRMKKLAALSLVMSMLIGTLAACSSNNAGSGSTTAAAPVTTAAQTEGATTVSDPVQMAGMDGWIPFEQNVTLTIPVYDRSVAGLAAVDDNYWTKWVQSEFGDKYNITVEYVSIPRTDVMNKYSMLIAGGDTPTIMMEYDYPKVAEWASSGAMQTIDLEAFAQVAPTYYGKMVDNNQLGYTDINGETYFVLSERPYYNTTFTYVTFIRKDWLDEVGLGLPRSYEEYSASIAAIQEAGLAGQAPDGLMLPSDAYVRNFHFRDVPVDEAEWVMHSSLGTASFTWEPTYKYLKRKNNEYNEGWYSTEWELDVSMEGQPSGWQTDFINGKCFRFGGYMSQSVAWLEAFYENNPDAELAVLSHHWNKEEGFAEYPQLRADNPFGMIVGFSSYASENQIKAAWMYMEWLSQPEIMFTMENGFDGVTFTYGEDGIPVVNKEYTGDERLGYNMNIDYTCVVHASKTIGDTIEDAIKATSPQGLPQDFTQDIIDNYYELKEIADNGWAYSDPIFAVEIKSEAEYNSSLLPLWQEYLVRVVKCKPEEFDTLYAELSQKYLDAGYREVIDERLAAYEAGNTTTLQK